MGHPRVTQPVVPWGKRALRACEEGPVYQSTYVLLRYHHNGFTFQLLLNTHAAHRRVATVIAW